MGTGYYGSFMQRKLDWRTSSPSNCFFLSNLAADPDTHQFHDFIQILFLPSCARRICLPWHQFMSRISSVCADLLISKFPFKMLMRHILPCYASAAISGIAKMRRPSPHYSPSKFAPRGAPRRNIKFWCSRQWEKDKRRNHGQKGYWWNGGKGKGQQGLVDPLAVGTNKTARGFVADPLKPAISDFWMRENAFGGSNDQCTVWGRKGQIPFICSF